MNHFCFLGTRLSEVEASVPGGPDLQDAGSKKYGLLEVHGKKGKKHVPKVAPKSEYITSSIRATLRHLNAEAGDLSMLRGIGTTTAVYLLMVPVWLGLEMNVLRAACLAVSVDILADDILEAAFYYLWQSGKPKSVQPKANHGKNFRLGGGSLFKVSVAMVLWTCIRSILRSQIKPLARVALLRPFETISTRVYASMLRDNEDPVVPMDRSFRGRPHFGGILQRQARPPSFLEAARTIDKKTYIRLIKLKFKLHVIRKLVAGHSGP
ncbi:hypothetical protein D6D17_09184 [Aureobasidium pullulans]|nr:hypothetical protein D6D17_09184 [Aureobasidium pullulans]